jgi:hypothetical protein
MFRKTSTQLSIDSVEMVLGPQKVEKLEATWAKPFRDQILPLIDEESFKESFHERMGAPNKSIRTLVALHLLKELNDLSDAEVIEGFAWNTQWQYALDVPPVEADICRKSLHNFRQILIKTDQGKYIFDSLTNRIAALGGLSFSLQRKDSTHIISNIKILHRLGLFVSCIEQFLKKLKNKAPELVDSLPHRIHERYLEREGYFADSRSSKAKRRLEDCAKDLWYLLDRFREHEEIRGWEQYGRLSRLFSEQCKVEPGVVAEEERVRVKEPSSKKEEDRIPTNSLQSHSDDDVTYGHKGKGYEVQANETCSTENAFQVLTDVEVTDSCGSDHNDVLPGIERQKEVGREPERVYVDSGYMSEDALEQAHEEGVELFGHLPKGSAKDELLHLEDFELDEDGMVQQCPCGYAPLETICRENKVCETVFDRSCCEACEMNTRCPVMRNEIGRDQKHPERKRKHRKPPRLRTSKDNRTRAAQRRKQRTKEFKDAYKIRSGIEATNSELKRKHGLGKLRVRGKKRVRLAVHFKAAALNVKRFLGAVAKGAVCLDGCLCPCGPAAE